MTYSQALQYLESFINYEKISAYPYKKSIKLERIKNFLSCLGNPQDQLKCIHVAGTKGKGSTCVFIAYILRAAGYRVGLYTSPHLSDFRERIRILTPNFGHPAANSVFEGMITQRELSSLVQRIKPLIEKYNKISPYGVLSFFEIYTALAFCYFKEKKSDYVVLETGLGGRLDATNVVQALVCALTPISYEHTQKLGNSLAEIAKEKVGIIKPSLSELTSCCLPEGNPGRQPIPPTNILISAPQAKEAMRVIRKRCLKTGAKLYTIGRDITYKKNKDSFDVKGRFWLYRRLKIRLLGEHQIINAAVSIGVIEELRIYGIKIGIAAIKKGLYNASWPGRCEVISRNPLVILDGAQNVASASAIKDAIKQNFRYKKLILVFGISKDKDIKGVCRIFSDFVDKVVLTKADNPRAAATEALIDNFPAKDIFLTPGVKEARRLVYQIAGKRDLILVTGSLFVVGEFRDVQ